MENFQRYVALIGDGDWAGKHRQYAENTTKQYL